MHARKKMSIFLESMEYQLSNALSIIKIGQKLASVRYFKIWWQFFFTGKKIVLRGSFFLGLQSNFKNLTDVGFWSEFSNRMFVNRFLSDHSILHKEVRPPSFQISRIMMTFFLMKVEVPPIFLLNPDDPVFDWQLKKLRSFKIQK